MKDIKPYLPFYLGCDYRIESHWMDADKEGSICTGLNLSNIIDHQRGQVVIKPIFRHLSSMTEEEALNIAKLVSEPQFIESVITNISYKPTAKDGLFIQCIDWEAYQIIKHRDDKPQRLLLHICNWGSITLYLNGQLAGNNKAIVVVQYLLSKHFDLFGLIESGLAIPQS